MKKNKRDIEHKIALNALKNGREVVEVIDGKYKGRFGEVYDANECNVLVRLLRSNEEIELDAGQFKNIKLVAEHLQSTK